MNILIPDIWLREFLHTKATPEKLKECLSLCGPSVERIFGTGKETVYDIEITGNRPDAMSVIGIAREAAAILPGFGIAATLTDDPYTDMPALPGSNGPLKLTLTTDFDLNPRWMSVVIDSVKIGKSPAWLSKYLRLSGIRSLNNVVDVTNFLMRAYGQPAHVFDYDAVSNHTMRLRASKKGEILTTLDGKKHALPGGDIVIEDGSGKLVDLCGIMGGENSSVTEKTKRVMLFLQNYNQAAIRRTSMALSHRTEASSLFEKGLDAELVKPVFARGVKLIEKLTGGKANGPVIDLYPHPYRPKIVRVAYSKIRTYIGSVIPEPVMKHILISLGFTVKKEKHGFAVSVPSFRRDITLDVDIIEEIARMYGYSRIPSRLPEHAPPETMPDPSLHWEEELKIRLRDWGYTEIITYAMLSEKHINAYGLDTKKAYKITNPLSDEWIYMRPNIWPGFLDAIKSNVYRKNTLRLFEIANTYRYQAHDLPQEYPTLIVGYAGDQFFHAKGLAEAVFDLFGIPFPDYDPSAALDWYEANRKTGLGVYGSVGVVHRALLDRIGIPETITILELFLPKLIENAVKTKTFRPVPNHPASSEDMSFIVPDRFAVGSLIRALTHAHPYVSNVTLLDVHDNTRTLHVTYLHPERTLTNEEILAIRNVLLKTARQKFSIELKT